MNSSNAFCCSATASTGPSSLKNQAWSFSGTIAARRRTFGLTSCLTSWGGFSGAGTVRRTMPSSSWQPVSITARAQTAGRMQRARQRGGCKFTMRFETNPETESARDNRPDLNSTRQAEAKEGLLGRAVTRTIPPFQFLHGRPPLQEGKSLATAPYGRGWEGCGHPSGGCWVSACRRGKAGRERCPCGVHGGTVAHTPSPEAQETEESGVGRGRGACHAGTHLGATPPPPLPKNLRRPGVCECV